MDRAQSKVDKTMTLKRTFLRLAVGVFVLLGTMPAWADNILDMQLFAPADVTDYGRGPQPAQGCFFVWDYLNWSISAPDRVPIGFPNLTRTVFYTPSASTTESNTADTGELRNTFVDGHRFEFGRMGEEWGWQVGFFTLHDQSQTFYETGPSVVFQDVTFGQNQRHLQGYVADMIGYTGTLPTYANFVLRDLPCTFDTLTASNETKTYNVEAMAMYRFHQLHDGGFVELSLGARYMVIDDTFTVQGFGSSQQVTGSATELFPGDSRFMFDRGSANDGTNPSPIAPNTVLADSFWSTNAINRVIGPQIGAKWFKTHGRWTLSTEGRFMAGVNAQTIHQYGVLGSKLDAPMPFAFIASPTITSEQYPYVPAVREPMNFDHTLHLVEFSPTTELRVELKFQVTRAVYLKAGWTGMWMGGVARSVGLADYTLSTTSYMGINRHNAMQDIFIHGATFGVDVNR